MSTRDFAEALLFEEEGTALDFKSAQYTFERATDEEKSELLKDIISFANTFRRSDAYIFIGVMEVKGGRSTVVGVSNHIDDAKLQQFVNSKTNRPIEFSYIPLGLDGKQVALIRIAVQPRPVFLTRDYGRLSKDVVYVRRGSSTGVAKPDEIAEMGKVLASVSPAPNLSAFFVTGDSVAEKSVVLKTTNIDIPPDEDFPKYGVRNVLGTHVSFGSNENYYVECAKYEKARSAVAHVRFRVRNSGNSVARDVRLVLTISAAPEELKVWVRDDLPDPPTRERSAFGSMMRIAGFQHTRDIFLERLQSHWKISIHLGKIQAMDESTSGDLLFLGAAQSRALRIAASIFSDDLAEPAKEELSATFDVDKKLLSVAEIVTREDHAN